MAEVCNCDLTGSIWGCAGCDVVEDYFPTAEEQYAAEADSAQMCADGAWDWYDIPEFDG